MYKSFHQKSGGNYRWEITLLARSIIDLVCPYSCGPNMSLSITCFWLTVQARCLLSNMSFCLFSSIFVDSSSLCIKEWPQRIFCAVISVGGLAEQDTENQLGRVHLQKIPTSSQPQLSTPSPSTDQRTSASSMSLSSEPGHQDREPLPPDGDPRPDSPTLPEPDEDNDQSITLSLHSIGAGCNIIWL